MNETRLSYTRFLPIVFFGALLAGFLQIYHDINYLKEPDSWPSIGLMSIVSIIKYGALWTAVALAFRQIKPAMTALGVTLLLVTADFFIASHSGFLTSIVFNDLYTVLFNVTFLPGIVFGLICFKTPALRYFLPLWLFAYAITLAYVGCVFVEISPYNAWYHLIDIRNLTRVTNNKGHWVNIPIISYAFTFTLPCTMFMLFGESYTAAANKLKWRSLFRVDLANQYTKTGAITLFYILRFLISLLVLGVFCIPLSRFNEMGRTTGFRGQTTYSLVIMVIAGLALLTAAVLYYRKFLIEYFTASQRKASWLYWLVNVPVIGMLAFPFLRFRNNSPVENRTRFFYKNAFYSDRAYGIMIVMLALSFIGTFTTRHHGGSMTWFIWFAELVLFLIYAVNINGYYIILSSGALGLLFFFGQLIVHIRSTVAETFYSKAMFFEFFQRNLTFWLVVAFSIIQFVVMLPVFHLNHIKAVQEEPPFVEEMEEEGPTPNPSQEGNFKTGTPGM